MQDAVRVQVLDAQTHLDKEFPDNALSQVLAHLPFQVLPQIAILAQFHHNIQLVACLERIVEADDVRIVKLVHQQGLTKRLLLLLAAHATEIDLL